MSHHQYPSHTAHEPDQGGSRFLLAALVFFLLLLIVVGGALLGRSSSATEEEDASRATVRIKTLAELQAADTAALNGSDADHMPIDKAMQAIIPILNAKTDGASNPKQQ